MTFFIVIQNKISLLYHSVNVKCYENKIAINSMWYETKWKWSGKAYNKVATSKKKLQIKSWKTLARLNAKSIYKSEICTTQLKLTKN